MPKYVSPKSSMFLVICRTCVLDAVSAMKDDTSRSADRSVVGTLWSTVARVQSGLRTERFARRNPSKAWGDVTSWTRCRSMYRRDDCPSSSTR
jgi:hypothetical protein